MPGLEKKHLSTFLAAFYYYDYVSIEDLRRRQKDKSTPRRRVRDGPLARAMDEKKPQAPAAVFSGGWMAKGRYAGGVRRKASRRSTDRGRLNR